MEIARCYIDESFYLPHNMDFRGRAYPLPPYLNQMGADNCRGLLLFKEAKPLGSIGLKWLKIHLANVYGFDKASLEERENFATEHLNDILDSANNGLRGRRWFLEAEDPWQCLAACCELRNSLRLSDPTQYASQLPIHQDGSCNGLQHYAALGGDIDGAKQVNLEPSGRPSDVYTGVAEFVKAEIAREAGNGCELAKSLDGKIKRKIVKQTVMTNVYGVTFLGAVRQVHKQLVDHYPDLPGMMKCSAYIARKIFSALGSMFGGAHSIQYWLGDCATRITQSLSPEQIEEIAQHILAPDSGRDSSRKKATKNRDPTSKFRASVIWTTPLGLPVIQPYRTLKTQRVRTTLQELCIANSSTEDVVAKRKQLQAFPPNFIHSLDATHMILSANECHRRGLTFSAVHDSFWTHACDIDVMNNVLRDAFVRMHSDDIIQRLAAEFRVRYGNNLFFARVKRTVPIGKAIEKCRGPRGKRNVKLMELLAEHKRQTLLKSEDAELQEQGRAMVTPASIFEQMNGTDHDLAVSASLGETAIGKVPPDTPKAAPGRNTMGVDVKDLAISSLFSEFDPQIADGSVTDSSEINEVGNEPEEGNADRPTKGKREFLTWLWLPMKFRDVPRRGEFDLYRIKESKYFFS
jgi:DNA-directed RNA polymerase